MAIAEPSVARAAEVLRVAHQRLHGEGRVAAGRRFALQQALQGADVVFGGRNYAYVPGTFTTDMPVGDVYVELYKGFEYTPVRTKVRIRPGQKRLTLRVKRWKDLRSTGWVRSNPRSSFRPRAIATPTRTVPCSIA